MRNSSFPFRVALASLVLIPGLASPVQAATGEGPTWSITPYLWAPTTKVDLKFRDTDIGEGEISFNDLLDVLDAAFMIQVEGGKGKWSAFGDLTYLKTTDTTERSILEVETRSKQTFLDAAVAFWPGGVGSPFNLFGGLRYTGFDDRYRFNRIATGDRLGEEQTSKNYYDALVGLRYRFDLSDRWSILTHGDYSFGDSKGTFLLRANLAFTVGKRQLNRIMLGYQYKQAEYKDGDLTTDYSYSGVLAGFNFRF